MNSKDHLLAIDYGTQSVRALLFDARGNLVSKARVEVEPYFSDNPGWRSRTRRPCGSGCARPVRRCGKRARWLATLWQRWRSPRNGPP